MVLLAISVMILMVLICIGIWLQHVELLLFSWTVLCTTIWLPELFVVISGLN